MKKKPNPKSAGTLFIILAILVAVLLISGCKYSPTVPAEGDLSNCQGRVVVTQPYRLPGSDQSYMLEVSACAYAINGKAPEPELVTVVFTRDNLAAAVR